MSLVRTTAKLEDCIGGASIEEKKTSMEYSDVPGDGKRVSSYSRFQE